MKPAASGGASEPPVEAEVASPLSMSNDGDRTLGPLPCIACGESVLWVRKDGRWQLVQGGGPHKCSWRKVA